MSFEFDVQKIWFSALSFLPFMLISLSESAMMLLLVCISVTVRRSSRKIFIIFINHALQYYPLIFNKERKWTLEQKASLCTYKGAIQRYAMIRFRFSNANKYLCVHTFCSVYYWTLLLLLIFLIVFVLFIFWYTFNIISDWNRLAFQTLSLKMCELAH